MTTEGEKREESETLEDPPSQKVISVPLRRGGSPGKPVVLPILNGTW